MLNRFTFYILKLILTQNILTMRTSLETNRVKCNKTINAETIGLNHERLFFDLCCYKTIFTGATDSIAFRQHSQSNTLEEGKI